MRENSLVKTQHESADVKLTLEHAIGGTPAFMSPEQVLGDRPLDARSDIYSVGCLAYWLVTGRLVFTGQTAMDVMLQHALATPIPPSQRTEFEISAKLDHLILACLEKNPDDRPPTADALATALAAVETSKVWTPDLQKQWWDRHHPRKSKVS